MSVEKLGLEEEEGRLEGLYISREGWRESAGHTMSRGFSILGERCEIETSNDPNGGWKLFVAGGGVAVKVRDATWVQQKKAVTMP